MSKPGHLRPKVLTRGPKTAPWGPQTALGVLRPQTETMYSWDTLFISLPQVPQQRESTEYWSRNSMTVVTARVFYVVSAFFYFHPQYQGRRHLRFTWYASHEEHTSSCFYRQHRGSIPGPLACGSNALHIGHNAIFTYNNDTAFL